MILVSCWIHTRWADRGQKKRWNMHETVMQYQLFNTLQFGHCALQLRNTVIGKQYDTRDKECRYEVSRADNTNILQVNPVIARGLEGPECMKAWCSGKILAVMFIRRRHFILPRHATCKGKCSGLLQLESERLGRFWAKPRRCIFLFYLLPCLSLAIVLHVRIIRASHRQPVTATYTHTSWGVMDPDTSWRHSRHSIAWEVIAWDDSLRTEARKGANAASSVVT